MLQSKSLLALHALIRLLSGVSSLVYLKVVRLREGCTALLAYVELLLATANGMPIKLTGGSIGGAGGCMSDSSSFSTLMSKLPKEPVGLVVTQECSSDKATFNSSTRNFLIQRCQRTIMNIFHVPVKICPFRE